jgi:hypothetical protein
MCVGDARGDRLVLPTAQVSATLIGLFPAWALMGGLPNIASSAPGDSLPRRMVDRRRQRPSFSLVTRHEMEAARRAGGLC